MPKHHESPTARTNPNGNRVWVARYTGPDGKRRSAGTFKLKKEAQAAIDQAYETPILPTTISAYLEGWTDRHPRSERTNRTNHHRISRVIDLRVDGKRFGDWPMSELKRRHALELVDRMLRDQHRSPSGAVNILRALSAMLEDAITDELAGSNPFKGVRVRSSDPRATKERREPRVWSWQDMHAFAAHARHLEKGDFEPMIRMLADCGLRVGELFALERQHVDLRAGEFRVTGSAWNGQVIGSSREKRHDRVGPIPPGCLELLRAMPPRIDSPWMFPTPTGKLWRADNFRRDIWLPTREVSGMDPTPQEFRHSFVSLARAAGVDPADLAEMVGHTVETATARYTHPLRRSFDDVRRLVG